MSRKIVCGYFGTIYDAQIGNKPGVMTENRRECTDECVCAVAEHMKTKAEFNKDTPGWWQYEWKGLGTLTWKTAEPDTAVEPQKG